MNDKKEYLEMLDIQENSSTITYKPYKKKKTKVKNINECETVKNELIEKINGEQSENVDKNVDSNETVSSINKVNSLKKDKDFKGKIKSGASSVKNFLKTNVVKVELAVIGVLIAVICLTSALIPSSGINTFFSGVFGKTQNTEVDLRTHNEFTLSSPVESVSTISVKDGVMTLKNSGSVYSPCDGVVLDVIYDKDAKTYTVEIAHSEKFKTQIKGIDYSYTEKGQKVFSNIPVGFIKGEAEMCFLDEEGSLISSYSLEDGNILWAVEKTV